ncbi:MAG TPA: amidohydrolase, partial [Gemmatimonadaceae bacterium]|nr:amidohydrolase [Gemmatimonadaceae bacterium]
MRHPAVTLALALALAAAAAAPHSLTAQQPPDTTARVDTAKGGPASPRGDLPLKTTRELKFTTDEGTWLSLDVSSDGRTIVFDLMGDLYTMPMAGGKATRITDGPALDAQPRFSPDGRTIAFVSDRNGSDNLWVADADGRNPRAITKGEKSMYLSPEWTPDGKYIVVSKNAALFGTTYDLWMYHKDGGAGLKVTNAQPAPAGPPNPFNPPSPSNYVGAAFGKDGRYIYAATRLGGAGGYNQTSFTWQVSLYDRETGRTYGRTSALGSAMRPTLSPDGKWLVYATRSDTATGLRIRDLASGDESWLAQSVQRDDQESRFTRDLMPGMSFTPDSKALVLTNGGKLWRMEVPSGRATQIPFTADVDVKLGPEVKFQVAVNDSTLTVQQIRGARPSPDGKRLAFTALDKVWVMDLPSGKPRRLTTTAQAGEHSPVWSPDGRYIAYVTWNEEGGDLWRVPVVDNRGRALTNQTPARLSRETAFYQSLNYTPDGTRLVAVRGPRQPRIQEEAMYGTELVWLPAAGGAMTTITPLRGASFPHFTRDSARVFIYDVGDGLVSMRFDGTDRKAHLKVVGSPDPRSTTPVPTPADEILISPDGDRALVELNNNVFLVTIPMVGGAAPTISLANLQGAAVPVRRLTRIGGDFSGWQRDGRTLHYSIGHSYFTYDVARADSLVRDSTTRADSTRNAGGAAQAGRDSARRDSAVVGQRPAGNVALTPADSARVARTDTAKTAKVAYEADRLDVLITVQRDRPQGAVVLRGARIITMRGSEVIENGDVLVRDNRIVGVGPAGSLQAPAGARVIDVAGKTIMPGYVDVHAHIWPSWGIHRTQVWEYLVNMAYGVTTTRDPQTATTDVLSYGDLVESGDIIGPRIFSTGPGVFWTDDIKSLDDARDVLRRYSEFYNTHTIKQYMVGDRKVRQWVIIAARELGLMPTLEGGLDFKKNMTEAMDGYSGIEHTLPIAPMYNDAVKLFSFGGTTWTPTLIVQYGGPWAENYFYESYDITKDAKLNFFTPRGEILSRGLRRPQWFAESQYSFPLFAAQAAKIVAAGGRVGLGSHGQLQGLGAHWELWAIAS